MEIGFLKFIGSGKMTEKQTAKELLEENGMILIKAWNNTKRSPTFKFLLGLGIIGAFGFLGGALFGVGLTELNLQHYIGIVGIWFSVIIGLSISGMLTIFVFEYWMGIYEVCGRWSEIQKAYSKYLKEQKEKNCMVKRNDL